MKRLLLIASALACVSLSGCTTLEGWFGRPDVQAVLQQVEKEAYDIAFAFVSDWIKSHAAGKRGASLKSQSYRISKSGKESDLASAEVSRHPKVPSDKINEAVHRGFARGAAAAEGK